MTRDVAQGLAVDVEDRIGAVHGQLDAGHGRHGQLAGNPGAFLELAYVPFDGPRQAQRFKQDRSELGRDLAVPSAAPLRGAARRQGCLDLTRRLAGVGFDRRAQLQGNRAQGIFELVVHCTRGMVVHGASPLVTPTGDTPMGHCRVNPWHELSAQGPGMFRTLPNIRRGDP